MYERDHSLIMHKKGKVLSFEQSGEFYYKRGLDRLGRNDLPDALYNCRIALNRDPGNRDISLAIGELLSKMYRFEESNRFLLTAFPDGEERPVDVYFWLGCNFFGLGRYDYAEDNLERYVAEAEENDLVYDAYDMLDAIDDDSLGLYIEDGYDRRTGEGRALLDKGDMEGAIRVFEELAQGKDGDDYVRNNLAMTHFCNRNTRRAMEITEEVLSRDPGNIHSHCNLALFYAGTHNETGVRREKEFLLSADTEDPDLLVKLSVTLMELCEYVRALRLCKKLLRSYPYDTEILHRAGVCAYETGDYPMALQYYDRLTRLNGHDGVAAYYRALVKSAMSGGEIKRNLPISYDVPQDEVLRRLRQLGHHVSRPEAELFAEWRAGGEAETLIKWAISLPIADIKRTLLRLMASFADAKAEAVLRDFVLDPSQPDDVKKEAFIHLKSCGAKEPILGFIGGNLVESRTTAIPVPREDIPPEYVAAAGMAVQNLQEENGDAAEEAIHIWTCYIKNRKTLEPLSQSSINAMAAAIHYIACACAGKSVSKRSISRIYGAAYVRLRKYIALLMEALSAEGEK